MKTRVQKWGNSLALRIPKSFAAEAGLHADAAVELSLVEGARYQGITATAHPQGVAARHHEREPSWRMEYRAGRRQGGLVKRKACVHPGTGGCGLDHPRPASGARTTWSSARPGDIAVGVQRPGRVGIVLPNNQPGERLPFRGALTCWASRRRRGRCRPSEEPGLESARSGPARSRSGGGRRSSREAAANASGRGRLTEDELAPNALRPPIFGVVASPRKDGHQVRLMV